jgi:hypothetical protein
MEHTTRKNSPRIKVYCLPTERAKIQENAAAHGMTLSNYLLSVGMGYPIKNILDNCRVTELARINGDLGRLAVCSSSGSQMTSAPPRLAKTRYAPYFQRSQIAG